MAPSSRCNPRQSSGLWAHHDRWHLWAVSTWRYHDRQFEQQPLGIARRPRSRPKLTIAYAAGYATTTQSEANATHGVDTHDDEGQRYYRQNTTETQPRDHSACDFPTRGAIYPIQGKARQREGADYRVSDSVPGNWIRSTHSYQYGQPTTGFWSPWLQPSNEGGLINVRRSGLFSKHSSSVRKRLSGSSISFTSHLCLPLSRQR